MRTRLLALLAAVTIVGSLFMPWFVGPFGTAFVPWDAFSKIDARQFERMASNPPPIQVILFMASFPFAAIFALLALIGREFRLQAIATGAIPVGLVAYAVVTDMRKLEATGLQIPRRDLGEILVRLSEVLGPGVYAWLGGAAVLLVLGLFDPGRRKA